MKDFEDVANEILTGLHNAVRLCRERGYLWPETIKHLEKLIEETERDLCVTKNEA